MWLVVMFDLPTITRSEKREYTRFRKFLIKQGFARMQYSVYRRHSISRENAAAHARRIRANLPVDGEVRILTITDRQFAKMAVFLGKTRNKPEKPPKQLQFF